MLAKRGLSTLITGLSSICNVELSEHKTACFDLAGWTSNEKLHMRHSGYSGLAACVASKSSMLGKWASRTGESVVCVCVPMCRPRDVLLACSSLFCLDGFSVDSMEKVQQA